MKNSQLFLMKFKKVKFFQCRQNFLTNAITEPAAKRQNTECKWAANLIISYLTQNTFARKNLLK
jgi:hypothetical protein